METPPPRAEEVEGPTGAAGKRNELADVLLLEDGGKPGVEEEAMLVGERKDRDASEAERREGPVAWAVLRGERGGERLVEVGALAVGRIGEVKLLVESEAGKPCVLTCEPNDLGAASGTPLSLPLLPSASAFVPSLSFSSTSLPSLTALPSSTHLQASSTSFLASASRSAQTRRLSARSSSISERMS
jgi:hypothetical protein